MNDDDYIWDECPRHGRFKIGPKMGGLMRSCCPECTPIEVSPHRPIRLIHRELVERLGDLVDEYFGVASSMTERSLDPRSGTLLSLATWPDNVRWIACYAVTGGSEGHYIHVDIVYDDKRRDLVFLGKTFQGMEHAQKMAAKCAEELGA